MKSKIAITVLLLFCCLYAKSFSQTDSVGYYQLKVLEQLKLGNNKITVEFYDGQKWVAVQKQDGGKFDSEMEPLNNICRKYNLEVAFYDVAPKTESDLIVHRFILVKRKD
jgi:hypothetical protein